jgi:hypothetical protein
MLAHYEWLRTTSPHLNRVAAAFGGALTTPVAAVVIEDDSAAQWLLLVLHIAYRPAGAGRYCLANLVLRRAFSFV